MITPRRFARWLDTHRDEAIELYQWARNLINTPAFPVAAWEDQRPFRRLDWNMVWSLHTVEWDEGRLCILTSRPKLRPTLEQPAQWHRHTWHGHLAPFPPTWPWDTP